MVYKLFDKETSGGAAMLANRSALKNKNILNKELAEELSKPIIKNVKKEKYTHLLKT